MSSADDRDAAVNALNAAPKFFSSFAVIRRSPRQEPSFSAQSAPATALFGAAAGIAAIIAPYCFASFSEATRAIRGNTASRTRP